MNATAQKINVKYIDTTPVICNIFYDHSDFDNPRSWDNLGTMVLSHKRYDVADEVGINFDEFNSWEEVKKHLQKEHNASVILPVQMYDHSGVSIYIGNESDRWDGGQLGYIYATAEKIKAEYGKHNSKTRNRAEVVLTGEVETYSKWINGEVFYFNTEDEAGNVLDSCGGYFDIEDIKAEHSQYENITYKLEGMEI